MATPAKKPRYRGVSRDQEVNRSARIEDVRGFGRRLQDLADTPAGTAKLFGGLAAAAALTSPLPFMPEALVLVGLTLLLLFYRYRGRLWDMPYRVPAHIQDSGHVFLDTSTGEPGTGEVYLGWEPESGCEVWAGLRDINTHRLVIGTTGSGKTEEMLGCIHNALMLGSGTLMIDGKADPKTMDAIFRLARSMGREEDLLVLNYIMGGEDVALATETKRSNTYNPLGTGSADMKAELLSGLLGDVGGNSDVWKDRAIAFIKGITSALTLLAKNNLVIFNPELFGRFLQLETVENLLLFGVFTDTHGNLVDLANETVNAIPRPETGLRRMLNEMRSIFFGNIEIYIYNLPGYGPTKPGAPHRPPGIEEAIWTAFRAGWHGPGETRFPRDENDKPVDPEPKKREKTTEQHGYISMQLVRAVGELAFSYRHIYNDEIGEISFRDVMLNRRIMLVMLPPLERSLPSMQMLGKMAVASIKSLLGTLLDTPLEGLRREIIEGRPSNAAVPFNVICDEYGYYAVPGFAVAPAQARSFGVSLTFGAQDFPSLTRASKDEGEATWENTNLRHVGRMTGGSESETYGKMSGAAGRASVQVAGDMNYERGRLGSAVALSEASRLEEVERLNVDDLNEQQDGEYHLVVGRKNLEGGGGARVVRYLAYYTGMIQPTKQLRLVHYVMVKPSAAVGQGAGTPAEAIRELRAIRAWEAREAKADEDGSLAYFEEQCADFEQGLFVRDPLEDDAEALAAMDHAEEMARLAQMPP